ncbi:MAG: PVC-type heme-binding CxxCH protein [Tunicatimonas sp.]|uniref:PVC-type heme-binding CxxCH protein n=1 Tax=Tunicatimonas sp. TaxID=1940096 RepID=UPI003C7418CA
MIWILTSCTQPEAEETGYPEVVDSRLSLELVAENPQIVTPIGLAIDDQDQLYVLESHTHSPPSDYGGPAFDRIKKGIDDDHDGIPESWVVYADSITDGMNLAFGSENTLFLVQKDQVVAYRDTDGNGASDQTTQLLAMHTPKSVYDHAGILGITYSPNGWLYISRGNTSSLAWRIIGSDSSSIEGYGDGGNVFRCRSDGSELEEVATGFWNPFDIKFTKEGRLMLIDNDPDSRGPNRLVDVTFGGDYGYQSLYGGSGLHPFLAWNGELPGTLPYAAGLGEAPSGLIDASFTSFPSEYTGNIISTIWEENNLVRVPLQPSQSTVTGEPEIILQGDSTFHPVALAANSRGDLYITDWVTRQYPNHGQGKIWRLRAEGKRPIATPLTDEEINKGPFNNRIPNKNHLVSALSSEDAFVRANARYELQNSANLPMVQKLAQQIDPALRLEAVLIAAESSELLPQSLLQTLLRDENEEVKRMALVYAARRSRDDVREDVKGLLAAGNIPASLFETYLATLQHLQPEFIQGYQNQSDPESKKIQRVLPPSYLPSLIKDTKINEEIRSIALAYLEDTRAIRPFLLESLPTASPRMQSSILQAIRTVRSDSAAHAILNLALSSQSDPGVRGEALVALSYQPGTFCTEISELLSENNSVLTETAVAYLCRCRDEGIEETVAQFASTNSAAQARWQLCRSGDKSADRLSSDEQWQRAVDESGNPVRGKLVFQSATAQCQSCHKVDGWGSDYGPDLSNIGNSKSARQLALAILEPSAEIAPEWQGWFVTDKQGAKHLGRQIDVGSTSVELMAISGEFVTYEQPQSYGPVSSSLMPDGLENTMTSSEFNDLIAYLTSLN